MTSSVPTTTRSEYFPSTADRTMISSSIHAEIPQNFRRNLRTGCPFCSATSLKPCSFRRTAASALGVREPCLGVHMEHGERVGNRRGGDVRGLAVCRLRGHRLGFGLIRCRSRIEYPFWRLCPHGPMPECPRRNRRSLQLPSQGWIVSRSFVDLACTDVFLEYRHV